MNNHDYNELLSMSKDELKELSQKEKTPDIYNENGKVNPGLLAKYYLEKSHIYKTKYSNTKFTTFYKYSYTKGYYVKVIDSDIYGDLCDIVMSNDPKHYTSNVIESAKKYIVSTSKVKEISPEKWNEDVKRINFENGILDIDTFKLYSHSPFMLFNSQIPVEWNESMNECPNFDKLIGDLTSGDSEVIELIFEFIGAVISNIPVKQFKQALFFIGAGDTGKSVLLQFLKWLLGDLFVGKNLQQINTQFGVYDLYGKRLAGCAEMTDEHIDNLGNFNALCASDPIQAEPKGKQAITIQYTGFMLFIGNNMPTFSGVKDDAVYRRMLIYESKMKSIPPELQDPNLLDKIKLEAPAILKKSLRALKETLTKRNGKFIQPGVIRESVKNYRKINSLPITFYEECCRAREPDEIIKGEVNKATNIYNYFIVWCKKQGITNAQIPKKKALKNELIIHLKCDEKDFIKKSCGEDYYPFVLTEECKEDFLREEEKKYSHY